MTRLQFRLTVALAMLLHLLGPRQVEAQGALGGTIRSLGGGVPSATGLTIRIAPLGSSTNSVSFPGNVRYTSGTYSIPFSEFPVPIVAGQTLRVTVREAASGDGADLDVEILDAQAVHLGNVLLRPVVPALLSVRTVQAPALVLRGQRDVRVEAKVENSGGETGSLRGATLLIGGVPSRLATGYAVTTAPGNLSELAAAASTVLTFGVEVLSQAPLGSVTVNVSLDGAVPGAATPAAWEVAAPANIQLLRVVAPTRVLQGQTRVPVAVAVVNTGTLEGSLDNPVFRFSGNGVDRAAEYRVTLPVSNLRSLPGGQGTTLNFLVAVGGGATTGPVTVDVAVDGAPGGSLEPAGWSVGAAGVIRLTSVAAPTAVKQGQTSIAVTLSVANQGSLPSPLSGLGLVLTRNGADASADYSIVSSGAPPTLLAAGQTAAVTFRVDVSPVAPTGRVRVDGRAKEAQEGLSLPGSWVVSRMNQCPTAVAGADRILTLEASGAAGTVRLSGHDSVDPDRPTTDPASGLLEFAWRVVSARSEAGEVLSGIAPFQGGSATTITAARDRRAVDPEVLLAVAADYVFGLTVREAGPAGPGNEGCASPETFVTIHARRVANHPPAARALVLAPGAAAPAASAALTLGSAPIALGLVARGVGGRPFDRESPDASVTFRWSRVGTTGFTPGPPLEIKNATSREASVVVTAPGAYAFSVTVTDDGRTAPDGEPSASGRRRSYPSAPVEFTVRPSNRSFPLLEVPVASAAGVPVVSFSTPVVIPATATADAGGFPAVELMARAVASDPSASLVYSWRQILGTGGAPVVPITTLAAGGARFWPQSSGLYRFRVTVSDGVLGASSELIVPVDDLRPGGRAGVIPSIGGLRGGADAASLPPVDTSSAEAAVILDATGSSDRSARYGRRAQPLSYSWTQLAGDQDLSFDAGSGRLRILLPAGTSGEYRLALELDNGFDAVRQEVRFATTGGGELAAATAQVGVRGTKGGVFCRMTRPGSSGASSLAVLLLPLAFVAMSARRRRQRES